MSSYKNNSGNILFKNNFEINQNNRINLNDCQKFNSFKFQHFNNFFNNFFHDKLKSQLINYSSEKKVNAPSIFKNEILNETLSEKTFSDFNDKQKKIFIHKNNGIMNAKLINNSTYQTYNNSNSPTKYSSIDKLYISKYNTSKLYNKSTSVNSKYFSKEQYTTPNISCNKPKTNNSGHKIKLKLDISSISNNNFNTPSKRINNTSELFFIKDYNKSNKVQQLPKDAANCLLLFLKKNKKNLIKTSKYNRIYKKFKNIIDNIIDNIPEEDLNKKNNHENILGYCKRKDLDGGNILNTASLNLNNYNSKSEKQRHIQLLSELNILKGNIEKNKLFLEDFNIKKYGTFLQPKLSIKNMINKIFNKAEKFKLENKDKKIVIPTLNVKTSIQNNEKNKKEIESYSLYNRDKQTNKNYKEKSLNLSNTSSFLKEMEKQKLVFKPHKTYLSNYNLIIEDIGKEIGQIESEIIIEKKYKNLLPNLLKNKNKKANELTISDMNLFITSKKDKNLNTNIKTEKSVDHIRRNMVRKTTKKIIDKLNKERNYDKVEFKDIKRKLKLTEYIVYNKAKNKLKLENLKKRELYEYSKKKDNNINN